MQEFETFVYLDLEKTGSTFIVRLLRDHCRETLIRGGKHKPMGADADRSKFYFISVRDPLELYLSLYSFGCKRWGTLRGKLASTGQPDFYDGTMERFAQWLDFLLKPANTKTIGAGFATGRIGRLLGLHSYRYLKLVLGDAAEALDGCETKDDVRRVYEEKRLVGGIVRYESFTADLVALFTGRLAHAFEDPAAVAEYVRTADPVNASERVDAERPDFTLPPELKQRLREREWFLCETFGYQGGAVSP